MAEIKGRDYTWSKSWIEFKAPNEPGVYCLMDKEGKVIFVGKGNIRERLLSHWNRENSTDLRIWDHGPNTFRFELTRHPAERQAELAATFRGSSASLSRPRPKAPHVKTMAAGHENAGLRYVQAHRQIWAARIPRRKAGAVSMGYRLPPIPNRWSLTPNP